MSRRASEGRWDWDWDDLRCRFDWRQLVLEAWRVYEELALLLMNMLSCVRVNLLFL
jgi:hypothetical protein